MVLSILHDELHEKLDVCEAGGVVGADIGPLTWAESILKPAGLDLIELPAADRMQEAESLEADSMASKLKLGEAPDPISGSLGLPSLQCECS